MMPLLQLAKNLADNAFMGEQTSSIGIQEFLQSMADVMMVKERYEFLFEKE